MSRDNHQERKQQNRIKRRAKWFYVFTFVFVLGFCEVMARITYQIKLDTNEDQKFRAFLGMGKYFDPKTLWNYVPHHYLLYTLNPNANQIQEEQLGQAKNYYVNKLGFRGKEISKVKPKDVVRIVCIGGSTTFGYTEPDETQTYPALLEQYLNNQFTSPRFEVINAGTPGWTAAESLINFHFRILDLSPDIVIVYHGINDTFALRHEGEGKSDNSTFRRALYETYDPVPPLVKAFIPVSYLARLLMYPEFKKGAEVFGRVRQRNPSQKQVVENLTKASGVYFRRNMSGIADLAMGNGILPIFMTVGHGPWSPALTRLNQITREVASQKRIPLIDFEVMSKPSYFASDNVHLLRPGNEARADILSGFFVHLQSQIPTQLKARTRIAWKIKGT